MASSCVTCARWLMSKEARILQTPLPTPFFIHLSPLRSVEGVAPGEEGRVHFNNLNRAPFN